MIINDKEQPKAKQKVSEAQKRASAKYTAKTYKRKTI